MGDGGLGFYGSPRWESRTGDRFPFPLVQRAVWAAAENGEAYVVLPDEAVIPAELEGFWLVVPAACMEKWRVVDMALEYMCLLEWHHDGPCGWLPLVGRSDVYAL